MVHGAPVFWSRSTCTFHFADTCTHTHTHTHRGVFCHCTRTPLPTLDVDNFSHLFIVLENARIESNVDFGARQLSIRSRRRCSKFVMVYSTFGSIILVQISRIIILQLKTSEPAVCASVCMRRRARNVNIDLKCSFFLLLFFLVHRADPAAFRFHKLSFQFHLRPNSANREIHSNRSLRESYFILEFLQCLTHIDYRPTSSIQVPGTESKS